MDTKILKWVLFIVLGFLLIGGMRLANQISRDLSATPIMPAELKEIHDQFLINCLNDNQTACDKYSWGEKRWRELHSCGFFKNKLCPVENSGG